MRGADMWASSLHRAASHNELRHSGTVSVEPLQLARAASANLILTARDKVAGFTLIEVLAALIIVSLGMLGVIQAVGQTASNSSYLRDKTIAHWIAMNRITDVRLQPQTPKIDKSSDEIEMAGRRWRWTMEVTQTPVQSVRRIDVSVRYAEANERSSLARITGFYGTAIAPAGSTLVSWQSSGTPVGDAESGDGSKDRTLNPNLRGNNPPAQPPPESPEPEPAPE